MRRLHLPFVTLILLTAAVGGLLLHFLRDPVTWSNFQKIETGMTTEEVRHLLGPARDQPGATETIQPTDATAVRVSRWFGKDGLIEVGIDEHGLVNWKRFTAGARSHGRFGVRDG